jgi:hypothetical protein
VLATALTAAALLFAPPVQADAAGDGAPDVRGVAFGQVDAHFELSIRMATPDKACVVLAAHRLCLSGRVLRYDGRRVDATVTRPDAHTLHARFGTGEITLARGTFSWWVEAGTDRVPDAGAFTATRETLAQPDCYAAAARGCTNRALRDVLVPNRQDAPLLPNAPCRITVRAHCEFGVTGRRRTATFALLGDSHAATWRAALEVVAQARRWRGVSITRPGCPFSTRIPASPDLGPADCVALHEHTLRYLRASRINTVFIASWAQPPSGPHAGSARYGGGAAEFGVLLDRLPKTVRHVYVLRDNPGTTLRARACLCAAPRAQVLTPDPLAAAARARGPRMRVIDLTRYFCGPSTCRPAIGGAYVYKDDNHMNSVFATSLGPFLLKALP